MIEVTLRDYFAGLAMQKLLSVLSSPSEYELLCKKAYAIADTMLEKRKTP